VVVDPVAKARVVAVKLAGAPDYVRFVAPDQVWVTEPRDARLEVFTLDAAKTPVHTAFLEVKEGPEALVVDAARGRAYTNAETETLAIDLKTRTIAARWKNGCRGAEGLALDAAGARLFVACHEGRIAELDLTNGRTRAALVTGVTGVDIIAYSPAKAHLYVPGAESGTMAVVAVAPDGAMKVVATEATAKRAHCVVADVQGHAYVCDPERGRLLLYDDR
jgi:DNA-binding beta-propeller fold protein YncE